jgi:hypothetical protein
VLWELLGWLNFHPRETSDPSSGHHTALPEDGSSNNGEDHNGVPIIDYVNRGDSVEKNLDYVQQTVVDDFGHSILLHLPLWTFVRGFLVFPMALGLEIIGADVYLVVNQCTINAGTGVCNGTFDGLRHCDSCGCTMSTGLLLVLLVHLGHNCLERGDCFSYSVD